MKRNIVKISMACIFSASILFSFGCSKLTTENYDKLKMGMDYKEVVEHGAIFETSLLSQLQPQVAVILHLFH